MEISREDRVRMERAHVAAWPALNQAVVDGWLWRSSGGGSQRANSVSTIDFTGTDPEASIAQVESRYLAAGAPALFQTFDETSPPGLDNLLRERGYKPGEATTTMFKRIEAGNANSDVEVRDRAWSEWRDVYLGQITENRRATNAIILDHITGPRAFFGGRLEGRVVSTALCVVRFRCAVIECVATHPDIRRKGAARSVMAALERWAGKQPVDWIGLQVVTGNVPAVTLYQRLGFVAGATNNFWAR
jgi:GNAT superfamily N-acetyltransferase